MPESSVLGTTDRHEVKGIDSATQYSCMLGGTVQVNVPEFPRPEMTAPPTTQSTGKKRGDRLVTNQREADGAGSCCCGEQNAAVQWAKIISDWTGSGVAYTTVQFSSDVFQRFFRRFLWRRGMHVKHAE